MPVFTLNTNVPSNKVTEDFLKTTTQLLANILGKPENYVSVCVNADQQHLIFSGTNDPCGYCTLMSIGKVGGSQNNDHSGKLFKHITDGLGIPGDSVPMPVFILQTNIAKVPPLFIGQVSQMIAKLTDKPEERVMCVVHPNIEMTFGGAKEPCAFASLTSIGKIDPESNKKYSAALCQLVEKELGVPQKRFYIKFEDLAPTNLGHDGGTKG